MKKRKKKKGFFKKLSSAVRIIGNIFKIVVIVVGMCGVV